MSVVTGSQNILVAILKNAVEIPNTRNTITFGAASGNVMVATLQNTVSLSTNDYVTLGIGRSTTDTVVTYTGTLFVRNILAA